MQITGTGATIEEQANVYRTNRSSVNGNEDAEFSVDYAFMTKEGFIEMERNMKETEKIGRPRYWLDVITGQRPYGQWPPTPRGRQNQLSNGSVARLTKQDAEELKWYSSLTKKSPPLR